MTDTAAVSDKAIGLGVLFGVLAVLGALGMFAGATDHLFAGWSFAIAMLTGTFAIAAIHVFSE
jgi:hypothetical protein